MGQRLPVMVSIRLFWRFVFPYLLLLAIWATSTLFVPDYLIPGPGEVLREVIQIVVGQDTREQIFMSLYHMVLGVGFSVVVGTIIGLCFGLVARVRMYFESMIPFFQSMPGISWSFLSLIWFGLSSKSVIFVIFVSTFASMIFNVWEGTKNVDPALIKMAKSFGYRRMRLLIAIYIPSILPFIIAGVRVVIGTGWKVAVVAEMLVGGVGIGSELYTAAYALKIQTVLADSLIIVALMMFIEYGLFRFVERKVMAWKQS